MLDLSPRHWAHLPTGRRTKDAALETPVRCFQPLTQFLPPWGKARLGNGVARVLGGPHVQPLSFDGVRQLPSAEKEYVSSGHHVLLLCMCVGGQGGSSGLCFKRGFWSPHAFRRSCSQVPASLRAPLWITLHPQHTGLGRPLHNQGETNSVTSQSIEAGGHSR